MTEKNPNIKVLKYNGIKEYSTFQCLICGHIWDNNSQSMLGKLGRECPNCKLYYHGERKIELFLDKLGIPYKREYKFPDCKYKRPLKFDFYLPQSNICIEYDGEHHYVQKRGNWSDKETTIVYDNIKNDYCKKNKIPLIRIPYWDYDDLEYLLFDELVKLKVIEEIN